MSSQNFFQQQTKYGAGPSNGPAPIDVSPELHLKMSKKIAQLTKVSKNQRKCSIFIRMVTVCVDLCDECLSFLRSHCLCLTLFILQRQLNEIEISLGLGLQILLQTFFEMLIETLFARK